MAIDKGVFEWQGFSGAPGFSVFYATPNSGVASDLKDFFSALTGIIPTVVSVLAPTQGDQLDEFSGELVGTWTGGPGGTVDMTALGTYAAPVGASITWETNGIAKGRRVRGRTFLVPLASASYEADGTIGASTLSAIQNAADALVAVTAGNLLIWSRPVGGVGGSAHPVIGARVADKVAVLRSRRD